MYFSFIPIINIREITLSVIQHDKVSGAHQLRLFLKATHAIHSTVNYESGTYKSLKQLQIGPRTISFNLNISTL